MYFSPSVFVRRKFFPSQAFNESLVASRRLELDDAPVAVMVSGLGSR